MVTEYRTADFPYVLGRGKVLIRKETDLVWYDLFQVPEFKVNLETEEKEHESFRSSLKVVDRTAVLKAKAGFSFKVDVPMVDNVRKFLLADDTAATAVTQTQGQWTAAEMTITEKGTWQVIKAGVAQLTDYYHWCRVTLVTTGAGPTTLTEGTDYIVDRNRGLILVLPEATLTDDKIKVTGDYGNIAAAEGILEVEAGSSADVRRHLWFQGDPADGVVQDVMGYVLMRPSGDMDFIGDEWQGFSFEGSFLAHADYGDLGLKYIQRGYFGTTWPVYT